MARQVDAPQAAPATPLVIAPEPKPERVMILVPAYDEEASIGGVIREVRLETQTAIPGAFILVVDDRSRDGTTEEARRNGVRVLELPVHLGLGGCVQAGYQLAWDLGYDYVIRVDGDGQHNARDIPRILEVLRSGNYEMVIGSRFLNGAGKHSNWFRAAGISIFRAVLRPILGKRVSDPTSGFVGVNRTALQLFAHTFPLDYPEIEALVVLQRKRFRFVEIASEMRPRRAGRSSITTLKAFYYLVHVLLGVFVNVLRFEGKSPWIPKS